MIIFFYNSDTSSGPEQKVFPFSSDNTNGRKWIAVIFKTNCSHCKYLLADLSDIYSKKQAPELNIYGISLSSKNDSKEFLSNYKIPFPVTCADSKLNEQFKMESVPIVFFIDENGTIKHKIEGRRPKYYLNELITEYFKSGKILLSSFSNSSFSNNNFTTDNIWEIIQQDSSSVDISNLVFKNFDTATEYVHTSRKNGQDFLYSYVVFFPNCDCKEKIDADYTYFSVIIEQSSNTILNKYYSESVYKSEIDELNKNNQNLFNNYAN